MSTILGSKSRWPGTRGLHELKTLEDLGWSAQPSTERPARAPLQPRALKACEHGYRVAFATVQEWVSRLEQAQDRNQLEQELRRLEG